MSNKGARKSQNAALTEEKEKRTDNPVKEMKKKIAANAEKEKQAADKTDKTVKSPEKTDKNVEKSDKVPEKTPNEKTDSKKNLNAEKVDKIVTTPEKNAQKADKAEKSDKTAEKTDKTAEKSDKKTDKVADKKDKPVEKKNETEKKEEGKGDASTKEKPEKPKQNGAANGETNGTGDTVSEPDSSEEDLLVIDDQDEVFPELTYDETSDADFEEGATSRSFTRRSQVKATKTPETPRPASVKEDDSKEKLLKMNDSLATDRKLRSADSPKPESKKPTETKKQDKTIDLTEDEQEKNEGAEKKEGADNSEAKETSGDTTGKNKLEMEVVIEVESLEAETRGRTRARVSPYTRIGTAAPSSSAPPSSTPSSSAAAAARHNLTNTSLTVNYTGNNTTMEMDISETSSILEDAELDDSSAYLRGLRTIRGRTSYKPLKELSAKHTFNRSTRSISSVNTSVTESARPTGTVVGRKRKPDAEEPAELAREATEAAESPEAAEDAEAAELLHVHSKRMRLFDRFSVPFRGFHTRRDSAIVGINTDLPRAAPVASTSSTSSTFDPETLKAAADPIAVPLPPAPTIDRQNKTCILM